MLYKLLRRFPDGSGAPTHDAPWLSNSPAQCVPPRAVLGEKEGHRLADFLSDGLVCCLFPSAAPLTVFVPLRSPSSMSFIIP